MANLASRRRVTSRLLFVICLLCTGILSGCATPQLIRLKDGREYVSTNYPQYDKESGFYTFTTRDGQSMEMNRDQIESIGTLDK